MSENKTVLITGADGFLGSHLTDFCLTKGFKVHALKKPNGNLKNLFHYTNGKKTFDKNEYLAYQNNKIEIPNTHKNLKILECDLRNQELLDVMIKDTKPKFLFHFGAQSYVIPSWEDPVDTIESNMIGTINIFEPLKR
ncbi:MAG: NAD-dependent epimerase/dehydratase family protein, partial [Promethearchaeota archaeon]